ncbi:CAP domain-containing protein [Georgenia yuyongxinii]
MPVLTQRQRRSALAALAAATLTVPVGIAGLAPAVAAPAAAAPAAAAPAAAAPAAAAQPAWTTQLETEIFEQLNAYRAGQGVAPLTRNASIDGVARSWSQTQAAQGRMSHNPGYGQQMPAGVSAWSENVAYLAGYDVAQMAEIFVDGWINSPGHRRNILDADMTHTGVGIAQNSAGEVYATQNFGRYPGALPGDGAAAPAPAQTPAPAPAPAPEPEPLPAPAPAPAPAEEPAPAERPAAPAPSEEPKPTPEPAPVEPATDAPTAEAPTPAPSEDAEEDDVEGQRPDHDDVTDRADDVRPADRLGRFQRMVLEWVLSTFDR